MTQTTTTSGCVELRAYAELNDFLPASVRQTSWRRPFRSHQTVKDIIEAAGIPHTEVELVVVDGAPVGFDHHPVDGDRLAVYPVFESIDVSDVARLRPAPLRRTRFVVDVNLGGLARILRLVGLDVRWEPDLDDAALAEISHGEHRILLTRDRGLLKRRQVTHGLFVRSDQPLEQAVDVLRRLDLAGSLAPFSRCLRCGGMLRSVAKADVLPQLEPRTRRFYEQFARCDACGQVYWQGSHHQRLADLVTQIRRLGDLPPGRPEDETNDSGSPRSGTSG